MKVNEHSPGSSGTYGAVAAAPLQLTGPSPFGSPGSNVSTVGVAVTVAHTGPADAETDISRHELPPARKSSGVRTYAHPNCASNFSNTGTYDAPLNLRQPTLDGVSLFCQAFEVNGTAPAGVYASGGLKLFFCR